MNKNLKALLMGYVFFKVNEKSFSNYMSAWACKNRLLGSLGKKRKPKSIWGKEPEPKTKVIKFEGFNVFLFVVDILTRRFNKTSRGWRTFYYEMKFV